ncbi:ComEC/Rec2 family competence protein [Coraliomargarita sp. W4R72]
MYLKVLEAKNGDSLLITVESDGKRRNLLIDGGPQAAYKRKNKKGDLHRTLTEIKRNDERIDLLILTHVDDDHIGGLLEGFKGNQLLTELVDEVWFNSGSIIHKAFDQVEDPINFIEFDHVRTGTVTDNQTSIRQGVRFEDAITNMGIWKEQLIEAGQVHYFYGTKITILSPGRANLKKLLGQWTREVPSSLTSASQTDYDLSFNELLADDTFKGDTAPPNGSSIALLLEHGDSRLLLLADAHDDVVQASIRSLKDEAGNLYSEDNPLLVDYIKLSHHGSRYNTSSEFLRLISSENFIVSTDGSKHGLPNKKTLARISKYHQGTTFWFNYPNLIEQIFPAKEITDLRRQGYAFKGCKVFQL